MLKDDRFGNTALVCERNKFLARNHHAKLFLLQECVGGGGEMQ